MRQVYWFASCNRYALLSSRFSKTNWSYLHPCLALFHPINDILPSILRGCAYIVTAGLAGEIAHLLLKMHGCSSAGEIFRLIFVHSGAPFNFIFILL